MRAPRLVLASFLLVSLAAAVGCSPRPLTEQEICGPMGCDSCTGINCSQPLDAGADAGP
jgi:hypothetical protein